MAPKKKEFTYFYSKTGMASSNLSCKLDLAVADDGKMEIGTSFPRLFHLLLAAAFPAEISHAHFLHT